MQNPIDPQPSDDHSWEQQVKALNEEKEAKQKQSQVKVRRQSVWVAVVVMAILAIAAYQVRAYYLRIEEQQRQEMQAAGDHSSEESMAAQLNRSLKRVSGRTDESDQMIEKIGYKPQDTEVFLVEPPKGKEKPTPTDP